MHDKDKTTHQHHAPFTLETYKEKVKPGMKVRVELSPKNVLHGEAGDLWGEGGPIPVIRFRDGSIFRVSEHMVHMIHLEPLN